jgi:hypothetical protein
MDPGASFPDYAFRPPWPVNRHHAGAAVTQITEDRRKLVGDLDRYGAILGLITDPQAIATLEQLIRKAPHRAISAPALFRTAPHGHPQQADKII